MPHVLALLALSGTFGLAAGTKGRSIDAFAAYLQTVAGRSAGRLARALVVGEVLVALVCVLAAADPPLREPVGLACAASVAALSCGFALLLARGAPSACHCFGTSSNAGHAVTQLVTPAVVAVRNGLLVGISLYAGDVATRGVALGSLAVAACVACGLVGAIALERSRIGKPDNPHVRALAPEIARLQVHHWWQDGKPKPV